MARPFQFDKAEILEKAMLLFWENGYMNTSFQDIVDRLELSRSSIYNSFSDKRILFIESLKVYINKESKLLMDSLKALPPTPESIKNILHQIVAANLSNSCPKGCLVVNSAIEFSNHDQEIKRIIKKNIKDVVSAFTQFIDLGQEQGNINPNLKAEELANVLFHQITALRVTGKIVTDKSFFDASINSFIKLFTTQK